MGVEALHQRNIKKYSEEKQKGTFSGRAATMNVPYSLRRKYKQQKRKNKRIWI
jgi:hypothetical protein